MTEHIAFSDEMLNAYLDNELAAAERKRILEALRVDANLRERLSRLDQIRNLLKIAYHDMQPAQHTPNNSKIRLRKQIAIAASLFIVIGTIIGWFAREELVEPSGLAELAKQVQYTKAVTADETWRVLLHISSNEPHRLNVLLEETESILREYKEHPQKVSLRILANGKGLDMLRDDTSQYGKRIAQLQKQYHNVVFLACAEAISHIEKTQHKQIKLLPKVEVTPSALNEVLNRRKEGWTYIKI